MRSLLLRVAAAGALAAMCVAGFASCSIYGTDLLLPAPAGDDASIDSALPDVAQPDVASPDADTCGHARWPARPASDSDGGAATTEVVAALATLQFVAPPDAGVPYGYDIDGVCTCPGPDSCINSLAKSPHCDDPGGRDDAAGALLAAVGTTGAFNSASVNQNLQDGKYSLLIQITNWNGLPDDARVTVAMYVSNGLSGLTDGGVTGGAKGDGTDRWTLDPTAVSNGTNLLGTDCGHDNPACVATYSNDDAYVAGGVVVASLDYPLALGGSTGTLVMHLTGSVVTARLAKQSGGWSLQDGMLAGRWGTTELLTSLAALSDPFDPNKFLCGTDTTYVLVKGQICTAMDVTSDERQDNSNAPCNAISLGFAFSAAPAQMAEVATKNPPPAGCADDAGTPWHDQCPQ